MKFLIVGDIHLRTTIPVRRKSDFRESVKSKLEQVFEIAKDNKVDYILQVGDMFESWKLSSDLIEWHVYFCDLLKNTGIQFITILGNHDIPQGNKDNLHKTNIGILKLLADTNHDNLFILLNEDKPYLLKENVCIYPFSYKPGIDEDKEIYSNYPTYSDKINIGVTHAAVVESPQVFPHVLASEISTNLDLLIAGHVHSSYGPLKHRDTYFVNPGALVRLAINEKERRPKVVLVESVTNCTHKFIFKDIFLANCSEEDFITIENENKKEELSSAILNSFDLSTDKSNPHELLCTVASQLGVPETVLSAARDYLERS